MPLDFELYAGLTGHAFVRRALLDLLKGHDHLMAKQEEITQRITEIQADLDALKASEAIAQADLTTIKTAVLSTVPQLQAQVVTLQAAVASQAALIDTFNADDVITADKLTALKAQSAEATAAGDAIKASTAEIVAAVQPPVPPVEPPQ